MFVLFMVNLQKWVQSYWGLSSTKVKHQAWHAFTGMTGDIGREPYLGSGWEILQRHTHTVTRSLSIRSWSTPPEHNQVSSAVATYVLSEK